MRSSVLEPITPLRERPTATDSAAACSTAPTTGNSKAQEPVTELFKDDASEKGIDHIVDKTATAVKSK